MPKGDVKLTRDEMLKALDTAAPALAKTQAVEALTYFWFLGKQLQAYNGVIGIVLPFKTSFEGGIRGNLFTGLMNSAQSETLSVEELNNGKGVRLRSGASRLDFALLSLDESLPWTMPKLKGTDQPFDEKMVETIEKAALSVSEESITPDQLGVTIAADGERINLYSTDSRTLTWLTAPKPKGFSGRVIMPGAFCQQLVRLFKEGGKWQLNADNVYATDGKRELIGHLIETPSPVAFDRVLDGRLPKDYKKKAVKVPERLSASLDRAVIAMKGTDVRTIDFSTKGASMRVFTKTVYAEVDDTIVLDHAQETVLGKYSPELIQRALPYSHSMLLTEGCCVMLGDGGFVHLIAAQS